MGVSLGKAKKVYNDFWAFYKPLEMFKNDLIKTWEKRGGKKGGFLRGLDGRKLFARSPHSLVNLMVQSTGSIVVKTSLCFIDKEVQRIGIDATQIIAMHDEGQFQVLEQDADRFKPVAERSFLRAGEYWKMRVPMPGELKFGRNWAETH